MMKEACTSKRRDLRVRADSPCATVQPPDKTAGKAKTFVFRWNSQACGVRGLAARLARAPRRRLLLVPAPGELRALLWTDVDLDAGVAHVTKVLPRGRDEARNHAGRVRDSAYSTCGA
jgi:hypothetical protein